MRSGLFRGAVAFVTGAELAAGLLEQRPGTARCRSHETKHLLSNAVILGRRLTLLLTLLLLLIQLLRRIVLLVLRLLLVRLLLLRLLALLRLLWRILLRCLVVRIRLTGPLSVGSRGLVVRYLRPMSGLLRLLGLLPGLLAWNLLGRLWTTAVVYRDAIVLIQRRLVVATLVIRH